MTESQLGSEPLDRRLLVGYLRDDLEPEERAEVEAHIARCDACRAVLDALARQARRIARALDASDFPQPEEAEWGAMRAAISDASRRASGGSWTRSAPSQRAHADRRWPLRRVAGFVLMIGAAAALAATPLRAWIAERWQAITGQTAAVERPPGPRTTDVGGAVVAFTPDAPDVVILFATAQSAGALRVRFAGDGAAELSVSAGGTEQFAVGRNVVRLTNTADATASYDLVLPPAVRQVTVRIGDADPLVLSRAQVVTAEIDLAAPRVRNPTGRDN